MQRLFYFRTLIITSRIDITCIFSSSFKSFVLNRWYLILSKRLIIIILISLSRILFNRGESRIITFNIIVINGIFNWWVRVLLWWYISSWWKMSNTYKLSTIIQIIIWLYFVWLFYWWMGYWSWFVLIMDIGVIVIWGCIGIELIRVIFDRIIKSRVYLGDFSKNIRCWRDLFPRGSVQWKWRWFIDLIWISLTDRRSFPISNSILIIIIKLKIICTVFFVLYSIDFAVVFLQIGIVILCVVLLKHRLLIYCDCIMVVIICYCSFWYGFFLF